MITIMRRYFKGSASVVLWIIVAAFIIGLMPMALKQMSDTAIWAVRVNGQEIDFKEFAFEKEQQKNRILAFRTQYGEYADWLLSMMGMSDPQILAVKAVTRRELINQSASTIGVNVGDAYLSQRISDPLFVTKELYEIIPPQIVDPVSGINQEMLRRYLKYFGLSVDFIERQIQRILTENLITNIIQTSVYLPEFDLKQKYRAEYAQKSFSIVQLSVSDYEKKLMKDAISDDTLELFYNEQNKQSQRYMVPEKRSGKIWRFTPQSYGITVPADQIAAYYEKNKVSKYTEKPASVEIRRILFAVSDPNQRIAIQEKAVRIKDELFNDPSQFPSLARRFSDDKESASNGGLLKPVVRGQLEPVLDKAAFILSNDGDISDVIETHDGFQIIQRVSKQAPVYKSLSSVQKEIAHELEKQIFQEQFVIDIKRVIDNDESLTEFIKYKGGIAQDIKDLAFDGTPLANNLFALKKGQKGFYIDGDQGIAVYLEEITDSYLPPFETVKKAVTADYRVDQAQRKMKDDLKEAKSSLAGLSIVEIQKSFPEATVMHTGMISSSAPEQLEMLKNKGIPVDRMLQMENISGVIIHTDNTGGFLIRLDEIEPFNQGVYLQKRAELIERLGTQREQQVMEGFVASLYRNAKIETNESVITLQA